MWKLTKMTSWHTWSDGTVYPSHTPVALIPLSQVYISKSEKQSLVASSMPFAWCLARLGDTTVKLTFQKVDYLSTVDRWLATDWYYISNLREAPLNTVQWTLIRPRLTLANTNYLWKWTVKLHSCGCLSTAFVRLLLDSKTGHYISTVVHHASLLTIIQQLMKNSNSVTLSCSSAQAHITMATGSTPNAHMEPRISSDGSTYKWWHILVIYNNRTFTYLLYNNVIT